MNERITAKIGLWKELNGQVNKIEASYQMFYTLFVSLAGFVVTILGSDILSVRITKISDLFTGCYRDCDGLPCIYVSARSYIANVFIIYWGRNQ